MRIVHLSDVHVWRYEFNPLAPVQQARPRDRRAAERAGRGGSAWSGSRRSSSRSCELEPDHILITGDLTTTALPDEFRRRPRRPRAPAGRPVAGDGHPGQPRPLHEQLGPYQAVRGVLRRVCRRPTSIPGSARSTPRRRSWASTRPARTSTPRGYLPPAQLARRGPWSLDPATRPRRLIVACHYPLAAPPSYAARAGQEAAEECRGGAAWLSGIGPHLYCCGHVHAAWAFRPPSLPDQLCLNSGAPLLRDPTGLRPPGFLEINLHRRRRHRRSTTPGPAPNGPSSPSSRPCASSPTGSNPPPCVRPVRVRGVRPRNPE